MTALVGSGDDMLNDLEDVLLRIAVRQVID
jgi:hypothetical protein